MDLTLVSVIALAAATLRLATPILFAALGEMIAERSGVLNLGIEGTMVLGAALGFLIAYDTNSLLLGVLAAAVGGGASGLLMALFSVWLGVNQHVSGLGITILGTGIGLYGYRFRFGELTEPAGVEPFGQLAPPRLFGLFSPLFEQYLLTYLALALVPICWWVLYRTHFGLKLRAVVRTPKPPTLPVSTFF